MILSSDELEILEYLKSWKGDYISLVEICRFAGGRRKYKESPQWARALMARLVDTELVAVNERGHYSCRVEAVPANPTGNSTVVEDYFAPVNNPLIVGDDYFPPPEPPRKAKRWVSPQMETILKKAVKKPAEARQKD